MWSSRRLRRRRRHRDRRCHQCRCVLGSGRGESDQRMGLTASYRCYDRLNIRVLLTGFVMQETMEWRL
ncbi:unnamed protein product [Litomosoides sigmodontis]|uniref:Uncharacterized protein n=1 Tax=Litomosoides sigmodontis TaxID=42156 RepID=A0A3P6TQ30_LITSI|nr:unnamed protein product [Litomosoides sigmodontis]